MNNERTIFSITPEALGATDQQLDFCGSIAVSQNTEALLKKTQKALKRYTNKVAKQEGVHTQAYANGAALTFINIYHQMLIDGEELSITPADVGLHAHNIADQHLFENEPDDSEMTPDDASDLYTDEDFHSFLDKLDESSPEFSELIDLALAGLSSVEEKNSFLRGVYDVFMPFYNKREAEYLHDHLVWLPGLMSAIESSYYTSDIDDYYAKQS